MHIQGCFTEQTLSQTNIGSLSFKLKIDTVLLARQLRVSLQVALAQSIGKRIMRSLCGWVRLCFLFPVITTLVNSKYTDIAALAPRESY